MKTKSITGTGDGTKVLSVKPGWGEQVFVEPLNWVESSPHPLLVEVHHDVRGRRISRLYYHLTGLTSLAECIDVGISERAFGMILVGAAEVIGACMVSGVDPGLLYLDAAWTFLAENEQPRFTLVPIERDYGKLARVPIGHLARLLQQITALEFSSDARRAESWRRQVEEYAHRPLEEITLRTYCSLLQRELGVALPNSARNALQYLQRKNPKSGYDDLLQPRSQPMAPGTWRGVSAHGSYDAFQREGKMRLSSVGGNRSVMPVEHEWSNHPDTDAFTETEDNSWAGIYIERVSDKNRYPLVEGRIIGIGRGSKNEIQLLGNPKISRNHATIQWMRGQLILRDLNSANGTWVDGRRLAPQQSTVVSLGQRISLANDELVLGKR